MQSVAVRCDGTPQNSHRIRLCSYEQTTCPKPNRLDCYLSAFAPASSSRFLRTDDGGVVSVSISVQQTLCGRRKKSTLSKLRRGCWDLFWRTPTLNSSSVNSRATYRQYSGFHRRMSCTEHT